LWKRSLTTFHAGQRQRAQGKSFCVLAFTTSPPYRRFPQGSIFSIMQPYGAPETPLGEPFVPCSELPNPLDISGRHCTSAPHLVQLDDSNGSNGRVHYSNSSYYRHLWCVWLPRALFDASSHAPAFATQALAQQRAFLHSISCKRVF
jgi:hypothetical protein